RLCSGLTHPGHLNGIGFAHCTGLWRPSSWLGTIKHALHIGTSDFAVLSCGCNCGQVKTVVFGQFADRWFRQSFGEEIGLLGWRWLRFGFWLWFSNLGGRWSIGTATASASSRRIVFRPGSQQRSLWRFFTIGSGGNLNGNEIIADVNGVSYLGEEFFDFAGPRAGDFYQGFCCFNFGDDLVYGHGVAYLDQPIGNISFGEPFADIGQGKNIHVSP